MQLHPSLVFLGGLVVIALGAELLLRGASRLATLMGVSPIVIGLTIVAAGTSVPELAVGLTAVFDGNSGLVVGNIAGTNIFTTLVILGLSALIRPLPLRLLSFKLDIPVMIGATLALTIMAWDGEINRSEGALLLVGAIAYTTALLMQSRKERPSMQREFAEEFGPETISPAPGFPRRRKVRLAWQLVLLVAGVAVTQLGAELLVSGAVGLAHKFDVSDAFIGLTIVAIGTSAPELATTLVATLKDDRDVAIGNLVGSCIYNILAILGTTALAASGGIEVESHIAWFDLPVAVAVAVLMLPVFRTGDRVSRVEGGLFVSAYCVYLGLLLFLRT